MVKDRDDHGRYTTSVDDDDIVAFVSEEGGTGTVPVAEHFEVKQPTAYRRLRSLEKDGRIKSRRIGSSILWEVGDGGQEDDDQ